MRTRAAPRTAPRRRLVPRATPNVVLSAAGRPVRPGQQADPGEAARDRDRVPAHGRVLHRDADRRAHVGASDRARARRRCRTERRSCRAQQVKPDQERVDDLVLPIAQLKRAAEQFGTTFVAVAAPPSSLTGAVAGSTLNQSSCPVVHLRGNRVMFSCYELGDHVRIYRIGFVGRAPPLNRPLVVAGVLHGHVGRRPDDVRHGGRRFAHGIHYRRPEAIISKPVHIAGLIHIYKMLLGRRARFYDAVSGVSATRRRRQATCRSSAFSTLKVALAWNWRRCQHVHNVQRTLGGA